MPNFIPCGSYLSMLEMATFCFLSWLVLVKTAPHISIFKLGYH